MEHIKIYQSSNFKNLFFRYYHNFFDHLICNLKQKYTVDEDRYFEYADEKPRIITLSDNTSYQILECDLLIENLTTNKLYFLSVCDLLSPCCLTLQFDKRLDIALISQYDKRLIESHIKIENRNKFLPWIYFPYIDNNLQKFYNKRRKIEKFYDELFFSTSSSWYRPILKHIDNTILKTVNHIGEFKKYCDSAIHYKIGLSLGGKGDICYRDVEYMGLGIPFIRFKYTSDLNPPLIPNYHYICIDKKMSCQMRDKDGNEEYANAIKEKFFEFKDNKNLLEYISFNAYRYYSTYLKSPNNVDYTIQLLGL